MRASASPVAYSREDGSAPKLADFHLRQPSSTVGNELAEQIAGAEAPFLGHVREARRPAPRLR